MLFHHQDSYSLVPYGVVFLAGILFPILVKHVFRHILTRLLGRSSQKLKGDDSKMYGLKHGVLNIKPAEIEMWMNMGYWKNQHRPRDLPDACRSLLREILSAAGIISKSDAGAHLASSETLSKVRNINVFDVGFGCGDQAIELSKLKNLKSYIGITIDRKQFEFARDRLESKRFLTGGLSVSRQKDRPEEIRQVFSADAAKPGNWHMDLKGAVATAFQRDEKIMKTSTWLLGLDVLYHLSPSRLPLFTYAHDELRASIMAFDLLLPAHDEQRLTISQTLLLRLVSLLTSTPYDNFLTPDQYRHQLSLAGYLKDDILIRDISSDVFEPLVEFMTWQDMQLKRFGFGIGIFHAARWIFGWWARSGAVRGCIIVARHKSCN